MSRIRIPKDRLEALGIKAGTILKYVIVEGHTDYKTWIYLYSENGETEYGTIELLPEYIMEDK